MRKDASLHPNESQYELLNVPYQTPSPEERLNPYDSYSDISRSTSPFRAKNESAIGNATVESLLPAPPTIQHPPRGLYLPIFLRRTTFAIFLLAFIVLAGVLGLLYALSVRYNGVSEVDTKLYYVWTYGPTAVFTILAVFWNQTEWRMMQWAPWSVMFQHERPADQSILLDYLAIWNVWAMLLAARRKHFQVALAVLGSLLISGVMVVSTGLFAGDNVLMEYDATLQLANRFDPPSNLNLTAIDKLPYNRALMTMHQNTTAPPGTRNSSVYELFFDATVSRNITASFTPNTTYTTIVTILTSSIECEDAKVIDNPRANASETTDPLAMESVSCTNTSTNSLFASASQGGAYKMSATLGCCSCGPADGLNAQGNAYGMQVDNGQDWRLFMFSSRFKQAPTTRLSLTTTNSDVIGFICKAKLQGTSGIVSLRQDLGTGQILSNLTYGDPVEIAGLNSSSATQLLIGAYKSYYQFTGSPVTSNFFLNPGDDGHLDKFFNAQFLRERAEISIPNIMAQVAATHFVSDANSTVPGRVSIIAYRLVVRKIAFVSMMTGLVLLGVISAVLIFIAPKACYPKDPNSIAAIAAILSRSTQLRYTLQDTGAYSEDTLKENLSTAHFRTEVDAHQNFSVGVSGASGILDGSKQQFNWWRPLSSMIWFQGLVLAVPILLIVLLESGIQISVRNAGLTTVAVEGAWHYFWLYIPPLLIMGARVLFNMVDSNTKVYQPFYMLSLGKANANSSLFGFLQGKVAIVALIIALRKRYWSVTASTLVTLFGPFLSIIVASLFAVTQASTVYSVSLRQLDRWNFSDPTGSLYYSPSWYPGINSRDSDTGITLYLGQEGVIPSMIMNYNFSYPAWTTKDLVLPTLGVEFGASQPLPQDTSNVTISARTSAIRANLNCQEHQSKVSWWSRPQLNVDSDTILTNITYGISGLGSGSDNCGYPENFTISGGQSFKKVNPSFYGESVDTRISSLNLTTRSDCPTRLFFLSSMSSTPSTKALICRPRLEEVQADITLNYPTLSFSAAHPPSIVSSIPSRIIFDGFFNSSHAPPLSDANVGYILNAYVDTAANNSAGLGDIFPSVHEVERALLGDYNANTFLQIQSSFGISLEDMFNDTTLMDDQVTQLYSIVVGQILRSYGRQPNTSPSGDDPGQALIAATLNTPNERERLIQNVIVTRILEGLLALMTICMIVAMTLQHTRHVVPKDPSSIVAVMSLLAGASQKFWDLFNRVDGVEWMTDKEMEKAGVFDGVRFKMGWIGDEDSNAAGLHPGINNEANRSGYWKVGMDERELVGGMRRRWCIDVDER